MAEFVSDSTKMDAVDILKTYAAFIREDVRAADFERHPYLPHIDQTIEDLRAAPPAMDREAVGLVAGPIWAEQEDDCFTAEIQAVGGHYVVATVHGATRDEAERRQAAILSTLSADAIRQGEGCFQERVQPWLIACFGEMIAGDREERNHRFLEEALELVQACGCTASEAHQLVDYVYGRPIGEPHQEVGGVMVTLAALCLANKLDMHANAETELARIWTKVEAIRAKQAAKPKHSPLPEHLPATPALDSDGGEA